MTFAVVDTATMEVVQCNAWNTYQVSTSQDAIDTYLTGTDSDSLNEHKNKQGHALLVSVMDTGQIHVNFSTLQSVLGSVTASLEQGAGYALIVDLGTMTTLAEWAGDSPHGTSTYAGNLNTISAVIPMA